MFPSKLRRACWVIAFVITLALSLLGGPAHAQTSTPVQQWTIAGMGDSVLSGWACGCRNFVELYADELHSRTHVPTEWHNFGLLAETSSDLLNLLKTNADLQNAVEQANIIAITIGANDFPPNRYMTSCPMLRCYITRASSLRRNLAAIIAEIKMLRDNRPTVMRITGYWEIWEDGEVGQALGHHRMFVNDFITHRINTLIYRVAIATGIGYVDLYAPFHSTGDDTWLLASDGNHPNGDGHQLIALQLLQSGLHPLMSHPA